jgi:hypothetical protein
MELTPGQQRTRERIESVIGLASPFLDLVLAVGDRISRLAEPEDHEYYPVRSPEEAGEERRRTGSGQRPSGNGAAPGTD